jgi:dipeptidase
LAQKWAVTNLASLLAMKPFLPKFHLLRLSLEISKTAKEGLENIIYYLEKYGQDACGGYTDKSFYYHNSFIIADRNEGFVLETAGKHWIYEKVTGYRAISNGLSIEEKYDGISKEGY